MPIRDDLGNRMKNFYESVPKTKLIRRMPVIIRLDGKAFHTFTRGFEKPFDSIMVETMQETTKYLCENIQGCVFGYTQSDEITLVLVDYQSLNTSAWFDYEVQKMCSVAASMATLAFNKIFALKFDLWREITFGESGLEGGTNKSVNEEAVRLSKVYSTALRKGAMFDARCFNIPKEEVTNCVYWRQLDAIRNSIQAVGQSKFSHNELHKKTCSDIKEMVAAQGMKWEALPKYLQHGTAVTKKTWTINEVTRSEWVVNLEMPILKGENRSYLDKLVYVGE